MSAIDPQRKAAIEELMRRRPGLTPERQAAVDELARRYGLGADNDFSNVTGGSSTASQTPMSFLDYEAQRLPHRPITGVLQAGGGYLRDLGVWADDLPRQVKDILAGRQNPFSRTNDPTAGRQPVSGDPQNPIPYAAPGVDPKTGRDWLQAKTPAQERGQIMGRIGIGTGLTALSSGASLPAQVAVGGAGSALLDPDNPDFAAYTGMAAPMVGQVSGAVSQALKKGAQERVTAAINPRSMADKTNLNRVIETVTKEKPFAWSSEAFTEQFVQKADEAAQVFDDIIESTGKGQRVVNPDVVAAKIDPVINALRIDGKLVTEEARVMARELARIKREIIKTGPGGATLESLRKLKQQYAEIIKTGEAQNFFRVLPFGSRASAAREGYHAAQSGMIDAAPELRQAGQDYHTAALVRDLLRKNETRNAAGRVSPTGRVVGTAMAASGHPGKAAVLMGALKAGQSTPWKLGTAALMTSASQALASGDKALAAQLIGQALREAPELVKTYAGNDPTAP